MHPSLRAFLISKLDEMSNRLDQEREKQLTPKRLEYAYNKLTELGYEVEIQPCKTRLHIHRKPNKIVVLFAYSGWWSGKGVGSGRGVHELIKILGHEL